MPRNVNPGGVDCQRCRGSGVVTVRGGPLSALMKEAGEFCGDCSTGKQRWEATLRAIQLCEKAAGNRKGVTEPPKAGREGSRVFVRR